MGLNPGAEPVTVHATADALVAPEFTNAVREGRTPSVTGEDARRALLVALACIESVKTATPVLVDKVDPR
jgi:myo-inositol 2-dehydrogenase/D-chiro-inositol 1-dehydrogenase